MRATTDTGKRQTNTFLADEKLMTKNDRELLKSAVIFGGNASGKSNVPKAFYYMSNVVRFSSAQIPIAALNESFAFKVGLESERAL